LQSSADYTDLEALAAAAAEAKAHGFDGATCVHPSAVAVLNAGFSPSDAERDWAQRVVAAAKENPGAFQLDGRMVDAPIVARARSTGRLIAAVVGTAIGLNILAGDQYVAIVMPSRVYRLEFANRGIAPRVLSRTVEDSGTVTSPLVPWNSCGAYMAGVLGVATLSYLPWCFFNLASPVISLIYGFTGFRIERLPSPGTGAKQPVPAPSEAPA
jgi:hypothetical protein